MSRKKGRKGKYVYGCYYANPNVKNPSKVTTRKMTPEEIAEMNANVTKKNK